MGAFDILHHLRERGLTVEPGEPGRLIVRPASKLDDDLREQIRAHKAELLDALVADRAAAPAQPRPATSCATCTHATPARTCGEPVAARLSGHFRVEWLDLIGNHGATCPAHRQRQDRPPPADDLPRLTPDELRQVIGWSDDEIARAGHYMAHADRHGFDLDVAERITDRLILRDRQGDDRRMCLECRHLNPAGRCGAARAGRLAGAGRDLEPVRVTLHRCASFRG